MLRSKQLLPFAKGARAWIVGPAVTKANTLDSAKPSITGSEDGNSEQGFNANNHGHGSNFHMLVPKLEEVAVGPVPKSAEVPVSAAAFNRIRQQSSNGTFIAPSGLSRGSGVNAATIPSRNVNVLLSCQGHIAAEKAAKHSAETANIAEATEQAVRKLKTTSTVNEAEATGVDNLHEVPLISTKLKDVGFAAVGRIGTLTTTAEQYPSRNDKFIEIPDSHTAKARKSSIIQHEAAGTRDVIKCHTSTVPAQAGVGQPIHDTKKSFKHNADGRKASVLLADHTIFFGSLDSPVVVPHSRCEDELLQSVKTVPLGGSQQEAGMQARLVPKSIRPDVSEGQKQRFYKVKDAGSRGEVNTGFPGNRKKSGGVGQARSNFHSNRSRKEPGWENASNEMVDQVSSILRSFGWTAETMAALAEYKTKLGAYHVNEVLKHQREPFLAWEFFKWAEGQRGYKHDVLTYTTMIGILGRVKNFVACNRLLEKMRKEGCEPSVVTYNRLIHSYGRANYLGEALKLFHHMQEVGCQPDRVTYCTLIDLHSKSGLHDTAMDICDKMWQAGFQPDTFSYTLIIHCLGKAGNLSAANKMFSEMIARGITPNLVTYNIMIDLHAKTGEYHMALKLYNDMQDAGHRPDKVTYSVIMEVLGHSGNTDEAEEVFYEMIREGWTADAPTFGLLVNLWGLAGNVEKACEWYLKMLDSGLTPNAPTINSLLGAYLRSHQYPGAMQVLESLAKWGLTPTLPTYTLLLDSCTTCDNREDVDSVFDLMRSTGHPAHSFICKVLDVSVNESRAHIERFFQSLRLEDQEMKRGFADALIEFLYRSEHKATAGHVWEVALENNLYPLAISQRMPNNWIVDLHVMSKGTAVVALSRTLSSLRERMLSTGVVPYRIEIVTGWGRHSRVSGLSRVKNAVQNMLGALGSPFYIDNANVGCFVGTGQPLADWLHQSDMDHKLAL
ncbi:hypothetical protein Mapa_011700 [Marchantia paleacea]|nr:hypothetical protein Mapa_011700 [Marchantia paleacea]